MTTFKITIYFQKGGSREFWADFTSKKEAKNWAETLYEELDVKLKEICVVNPLT